MKTNILKLVIGMMIVAQTAFTARANADELEQLRAQVQVISDVLDARIYEFSKKSTDKPAFDHADYMVARQRYFANMKTGLQLFKNEVLEIYSRFEPYFQVANSSFYSAAQKNQMLYAAGGPLSLVISKAERDYTTAFEKLLVRGMGDVYIRAINAKAKTPYYLVYDSNTMGYKEGSFTGVACNSSLCAKKLPLNISARYEYLTESSSMPVFEGQVLAFNQQHLRDTLGCTTFHCFTLIKSDFNETLVSLWAEFGREIRKFYFDRSKTSSITLSLSSSEALAGILGECVQRRTDYNRNVEKCSHRDFNTVNGQDISPMLKKSVRPEEIYDEKTNPEGIAILNSDRAYYTSKKDYNNRVSHTNVWNYSRIGNTFKMVDLLFAPLVKPY